MTSAYENNRRVWDGMAREGHAFTRPARDDDFVNPLAALDSTGWLGHGVQGLRVLCLASGGGRQSALFAAAGALVTVVDLSPAMLALDRQVAAERGLDVRTIEASMDNLPMLPAAGFDLVYQPVSTCYVSDVLAVYREVARVIAPGGLYISQHKQPASIQTGIEPSSVGRYELTEPYYRDGRPLPPVSRSLLRESGADEFLHRWEELVGGLCRVGFVIEDLGEPFHADPTAELGAFGHRACYVAPYVRIKARRLGARSNDDKSIWLPG